MKKCKYKAGLTLVEMLVAVSIIVILATMVIAIATRVDNQSKEQLVKGTFTIIDAALEQFRDSGYQLRDNANYIKPGEADFYRGLKYPVDCNCYNTAGLINELQRTEVLPAGSVSITPALAHNDPNYSGIEVMYFYLIQVPECRKTLDKIDKSLITNDVNNAPMTLNVDVRAYPLYRIVDPWKKPLRYDYYDRMQNDFTKRANTKKNFPVLISAGPDKQFGTADDIRSR